MSLGADYRGQRERLARLRRGRNEALLINTNGKQQLIADQILDHSRSVCDVSSATRSDELDIEDTAQDR